MSWTRTAPISSKPLWKSRKGVVFMQGVKIKACKLYLLFPIVIVTFGCVRATVELTDPSKSYEPTEYIQLLTEKPSRPYQVIAVIKGNGSPHRKQSLVFKKIEEKAREIGAQAVIPLNSSLTYSPPMTFHEKPVNSVGDALGRIGSTGSYDFNLKVAAIRFIDTPESRTGKK